MLGMDRFETASLALLPGQRVRARILRHEPWGVLAEIIDYEHVGASVDLIEQFGVELRGGADLDAMYPPVGTAVDAVVEQVRRYHPSLTGSVLPTACTPTTAGGEPRHPASE
jgi:hypothetical protein